MSKKHNFRNLSIWSKSIDLSVIIYDMTKSFPKHELYGLTSQIRRSAVSIPSNIAEGSGKGSTRHFILFLRTTLASAYELETQLTIANKLCYLESNKSIPTFDKIVEIQVMISALINRIQRQTK
jgi:four helix bundle protein